jgi:hypothetical protein
MRTYLRRTSLLLPLLAAPLGACNQSVDETSLADQAALNAREIVHQTGGAVSFTQSDDSGLTKIMSGLTGAGDGVLGGAMPAPVPPGMMAGMSGSPMAMAMAGMPSMLSTEDQADETADQLKLWLRERLLADANLESRSDNEAVYMLHPDPTCRALPRDTDPPGTVPALNQSCVDQLTRLAVRVMLQPDGDGVRLTILVGPDRLALSAFIIHSDLLAMETDLAQAYTAAQYIDQTLGTASPMPATQIEALAGRMRIGLHKDGEKKVTVAISVLDAIHVATRDASGAPGPDIHLGASDPTLAVTADGVNQALTVNENVGALDVLGDWDPRGLLPPNRDLHVAVGGVTGQSTFTAQENQITASGVGVGPTVVEVRGARVFDLTLNPNDGYKFDVTVALDAAGQPQVQVTPRFDLALGFHLGQVAADYATPPPSYLVDETYGIDLDNGGAPAGIAAAPATATFTGGIKVTAGTLTISSTAAPGASVVVPTGKCLTGTGTAPAGTHPVLGKLAVVDCN